MNFRPLLAVFSTVSLIFLLSCSADQSDQSNAPPQTEANTASESAAAQPVSAPASIPSTQMAIVQVGNGGAEVFEYQSIPVLEPSANEVLIKVVAAAINPIERRIREGNNRPTQAAGGGAPAQAGMGAPPQAGGMGGPQTGGNGGTAQIGGNGGPPQANGPSVPGGDIAGFVAKIGSGVSNVAVGDAVFAKLAFGQTGLNGAYSEYTIAPANQINLKPIDQSFEEAAGLGTVGVTALRTIKHADVSPGDRVFINGIAGGIGSSAAQFALERGAYVLGTASGRHHEYLESIGVHEAINYREVQFDQVIEEPVDVVIETVGTATANQALNILKPGGKLVSIAGPADAALCEEKQVDCSRIGGEFGWPNSEMLAEVARIAAAGAYRLNVDTVFPLQQAGAAQDLNFNVGTGGKVVLLVDAEAAVKEANKAAAARYLQTLGTDKFHNSVLALHADNFTRTRHEFENLVYNAEGDATLSTAMQVGHEAMTDRNNSITQLLGEGDLVAARYRSSGTHNGNLFGLAATGKEFDIEGAAVFKFENGKIVESWMMTDEAALLYQLGERLPAREDGKINLPPVYDDVRTYDEALAEHLLDPQDTAEWRHSKLLLSYKSQPENRPADYRFTGRPYSVYVRSGIQNIVDRGAELGVEGSHSESISERQDMIGTVISDGDEAMMLFRLTALNSGPLYGIPPSGNHLHDWELSFAKFNGDEWVEAWWMADELGLLLTIGSEEALNFLVSD